MIDKRVLAFPSFRLYSSVPNRYPLKTSTETENEVVKSVA